MSIFSSISYFSNYIICGRPFVVRLSDPVLIWAEFSVSDQHFLALRIVSSSKIFYLVPIFSGSPLFVLSEALHDRLT
uniref:Uncharacterized protein n=1 Tax=Arundo donax TaxID=35708 RepID=A0A0A9A8K4_ARUDO